jgi:hypothetical protein
VLETKEHTPTPSSFDVFTFGLAFESFKEFRGASCLLGSCWYHRAQTIYALTKVQKEEETYGK